MLSEMFSLPYYYYIYLLYEGIYLKQTMFLGYVVLQLFYIYNLCHR